MILPMISTTSMTHWRDLRLAGCTAWKSQKAMFHSWLKSPTISTHFHWQRTSEGVDKCNLGSESPQAAAKKLMTFQTTKGVTAATSANWDLLGMAFLSRISTTTSMIITVT